MVLARYKPDLVLLDISLPDGNGTELIRDLRESLPECRIMLMSGQFRSGQLLQLNKLDADGLFSKTDSIEQLQEAVACLLDGERYVSSEVRSILSASGHEQPLSPRQMEILQMADTGTTNKAIADQTGLTPSTVAFHLREARIRLKVKTTREAIKIANERGLL
jgi:two-component system response regulator DesR